MPAEEIYLFDLHKQRGSENYIALSSSALKNGLFAGWTGNQLAIFFLLLAHANSSLSGEVKLEKLENLLPDGRKVITKELPRLEKGGFIEYEETRGTVSFKIFLPALDKNSRGSSGALEQEERFLRELLSGRPVSEQDLVKGLVMILAPEKLTDRLRSEIEEIMATFSPETVKELIRRVKKALEDNPDLKPLPYLRGIVRDWVKNGITSYEDLQRADRLHRETHELAMEFGISRAWEMTPSHKEILLSWITCNDSEDHALSVEVARWAIQEAIRSKRDGRPSLNYIDRNFIQPLKRAKTSDIEEAREAMQQKETSPAEDKAGWDYDKYRDD